jgi:hypothetical protein
MKTRLASSSPRPRKLSQEQSHLERLAKDSLVYLADIEERERYADDGLGRWVAPYRKGTPPPIEKKISLRRASIE